jgi:hypothetical protein
MYRIMRVKGYSGKDLNEQQREEDELARRIKWDELVFVMESLEEEYGWVEVEGTDVYTKDEDPSHKSMVLGESWDGGVYEGS